MPRRNFTITAIVLFCISSIIFTFSYGPAKRIFVIPNKTVSAQSSREIDTIWHSSDVHGRIAVIFARHLNQQFSGNAFPETDYIDTAMRQGIVRTTYLIVPDKVWSEVVSEYILQRSLIVPLKPTDSGFIILHEGGRIHVMPLSKYVPELGKEKALIVIERGVWSQQENFRIDNYFRSGSLTADLVVTIGE